MKKIAIIYSKGDSQIIKKAIEVLSEFILNFTFCYPICLEYEENADYSEYRCFFIGTKQNSEYIKRFSEQNLTKAEEYNITVRDQNIIIEGFDDAGVLYGCVDFYNKYVVKFEWQGDGNRSNFFNRNIPDYSFTSSPSVKDRGIWTWGHVIYDYKSFFDNMVKLKFNTVIIWNDFVPLNAEDVVNYAHACNIKVIWGFAWGWNDQIAHGVVDLKTTLESSMEIFEKYKKEYKNTVGDGIYFQSFTELKVSEVDGITIAEAVADFVNKTAKLFYDDNPNLELQFGLHATSVREKLEYIKNVDKRIRIVWEDCGAFPFAYKSNDTENFEAMLDTVKAIANLRGVDDSFGVVTKSFTNLDWGSFKHEVGSTVIGVSSKYLKANRVDRKSRAWKRQQAFWLSNADKALETIKLMSDLKNGDLCITGLVEDGMFEENIMFPVALYSEMLWDSNIDVKTLMADVAIRDYVDFA